jgi:capsular exopolysaccharide synthesis family protein
MAEIHSNGKTPEPRPPRPRPMTREILSGTQPVTQGPLLNRDILRVLGAHRVVVGGTAVALGFMGLVFGMTRKPKYDATAVVQVTNLASTLGSASQDGLSQNTVGRSTDPLASLVQVLKGRSVAGLAVDSAGLRLQTTDVPYSALQLDDVVVSDSATADSLKLTFSHHGVLARADSQTVTAAYGAPVAIGGVQLRVKAKPFVAGVTLVVESRSHAINQVVGSLRAAPRPETDIVDVSYTARDPEWAETVVNAVVDAFQLQDMRTARQNATRRRIFLEQQLVANDSVLNKAQLALAAFRARQTATGSGDQYQSRQAELMNLSMRQSELAADRDMLDSALASVPTAPGPQRREALRALVSMPGLVGNPVISPLYNQLMSYQTSVDSATQGVWGSAATHPDVERLRALISSTESQIIDAAQGQLRVMDARLNSLQGLKAQSTATIEGLPRVQAEQSRLEEQVATLRTVGDQLREEHERAQIAEAVEAGHVEILSRAVVSRLKGIGLPQTVVFALLMGLMLGSGIALLREHLSTRVRRHADVHAVLSAPVLGVIPRMATLQRNRFTLDRHTAKRLLPTHNGSMALDQGRMLRPAKSAEWSEAYRMLSTTFLGTPNGESPKTVLVTSATPREGKSTVVANLAIALGRQRFRVLLMDCDLNRPSLHDLFAIGRSPGLCQVLQHQTSFDDAVRETAYTGVSVLPAGLIPSDDRALMSASRVRELIEDLEGRFDIILLDAPPILLVADSAILATVADGVLLVVRAGHTNRDALEQAAHQLTLLDAYVLGSVLNDPDAQLPRYGEPYYYGYYDEAIRT